MHTHVVRGRRLGLCVLAAVVSLFVAACEDNPGSGGGLGGGQIFAHDASALYRVDLEAGSTTKIAPLGATGIIDLAVTGDGVLYALTRDGWSHVDTTSGALSQPFAKPIGGDATGMDVGPDGLLYTAQGNDILRFDPLTGAGEKLIIFPSGTVATGDAAFVGDRLYVVVLDRTSGKTTDALVALAPLQKGAPSTIVGDIGFSCVQGLVGRAGGLYGFTCDGTVLRIDPATARGTVIAAPKIAFQGAAGR